MYRVIVETVETMRKTTRLNFKRQKNNILISIHYNEMPFLYHDNHHFTINVYVIRWFSSYYAFLTIKRHTQNFSSSQQHSENIVDKEPSYLPLQGCGCTELARLCWTDVLLDTRHIVRHSGDIYYLYSVGGE